MDHLGSLLGLWNGSLSFKLTKTFTLKPKTITQLKPKPKSPHLAKAQAHFSPWPPALIGRRHGLCPMLDATCAGVQCIVAVAHWLALRHAQGHSLPAPPHPSDNPATWLAPPASASPRCRPYSSSPTPTFWSRTRLDVSAQPFAGHAFRRARHLQSALSSPRPLAVHATSLVASPLTCTPCQRLPELLPHQQTSATVEPMNPAPMNKTAAFTSIQRTPHLLARKFTSLQSSSKLPRPLPSLQQPPSALPRALQAYQSPSAIFLYFAGRNSKQPHSASFR